MLVNIIDRFNRNINGDVFHQWKKVTIHEFPQGLEVFIDENHETCSDGAMYEQVETTARGEAAEENKERNLARAARRAKTQVRRRCKMIGATQMLTLTYRENMTDVDRLARDFKLFIQRMRQYGEFEYVAGIEKQKRGALHMHLAICALPLWMKRSDGIKVKSADLVRSVWRGVVGLNNGTINLTKPRRNAVHRIASYIAKYIAKTLEEAVFNKKSYWSSKGIPKPKVDKLWFSKDDSTWDIVSLLAQEFISRGFTDIAQYANQFREFHWFAASRP
jgi:hypothetical protein